MILLPNSLMDRAKKNSTVNKVFLDNSQKKASLKNPKMVMVNSTAHLVHFLMACINTSTLMLINSTVKMEGNGTDHV
jgi:hypothetical protein